MVWLEYQNSDGYVVKIHEVEPEELQEGHSILESNDWNINDEFKYAIYVHLDGSGAIGAVQQAPAVLYLLEKLAEKDNQIEEIQQVVADLSELVLEMGG